MPREDLLQLRLQERVGIFAQTVQKATSNAAKNEGTTDG